MPRAESTLEKGSRWLEAKYNWLATSHFSWPAWLGLTVPNKDELLLVPHNSQGVSTATSFGALPMARWRGYERATGKSVAEKKKVPAESSVRNALMRRLRRLRWHGAARGYARVRQFRLSRRAKPSQQQAEAGQGRPRQAKADEKEHNTHTHSHTRLVRLAPRAAQLVRPAAAFACQQSPFFAWICDVPLRLGPRALSLSATPLADCRMPSRSVTLLPVAAWQTLSCAQSLAWSIARSIGPPSFGAGCLSFPTPSLNTVSPNTSAG
ncbi:hypothetical protein L1887_40495 [Cichorium endivia]|nr:hypothetical protein L1887_40495 [Cichorium endivia]